MDQEGLKPMFDVNIYGRISVLKLFSAGGKQDYLFISTESFKFCILAYDSEKKEIVTKASGNAEDTIGRPTEAGQLGIIDPDGRLIALHLYEGLLKLINIEKGLNNPIQKTAANTRLEELQVMDMTFLYGCKIPTIAVLFKDTKDEKHIVTYEVSQKDQELCPGPWSQSNVGVYSSMLVAVPLGGVLVVADNGITYMNGRTTRSIAIPYTKFLAYDRVDKDGSRYLFGDHFGRLSVLVLLNHQQRVTELKFETLGRTSIPSSISYLDSGVVFIGSSSGDSQLIRLNTEKDPATDSYISHLENFTNIGPIVDFCLVDTEKQGQAQIVTCSGTYRDGTLRVIRNGIGIAEKALIELEGVKGLWPIKENDPSDPLNPKDQYLIVSFIGYTKVLQFQGEEIEETEFEGLDSNSSTILCSNIDKENVIVQVTNQAINLINPITFKRVDQWKSPSGSPINLVSSNQSQIALSIGKSLYYFEINEQSRIELIKEIELPHEISCIDISPLDSFMDSRSQICAVGLWTDITLRLFKLPTLEEIHKEPLGGEIIPRSILMISFEGIDYIFCSLGDGHLFKFKIDIANNWKLFDKRKLTLGTQPIILKKFKLKNTINIFALSDRPTVIYSNNKKLFYSVVNLKEVTNVTSFNSDAFPGSMAISSESSLIIGTIDEIQKLHIKTISLNGEMARRIVHLEEYSCYAVITIKTNEDIISGNGENATTIDEVEEEVSYVRLFDDQTFEPLSSFRLEHYEMGWSLTSTKFDDDPCTYLAVGTSINIPDRQTSGRVLLFNINEAKKLVLLEEISFRSGVLYLHQFNGRLIAAVLKRLYSIRYSYSKEKNCKVISSENVHKGHTMILKLASRGHFMLVGDMMKSMSLLGQSENGSLVQIAKNPQPIWIRSIAMINDDYFIGSETSNNFVVVKKNNDSTNELERELLDSVGHYHIGESINSMLCGSLVRLPDSDAPPIPTILYASVNGSIGVIASISKEDYEFFSKLQKGLNRVVNGIGGFTHESWRAFSNDHHTVESRNFIDGDLIEMFPDLKIESMAKVIQDMNVTLDETLKRIESLMQYIR
ncbi:hypothetical protein DICPUDRAFT_86223 [Dictyostelium purpureum]|uniref:DNA damage-binding protein 1 n=1 Tax=Dictyostelium purpureum TaxID=5786 RepID=F0ZAA4_DICPU|nr:uncharacterized protein DICPUDRAFT_86223 [Dictyostelium purpureum]EGC39114.1 hypothetical protein DICPUDRAFT_86223 [Dictyostelium purpureum]|eukprot:XP_003284366.1 hypothetical protein DICPUDRAFT_86223 [Dictyostelium purpureum]